MKKTLIFLPAALLLATGFAQAADEAAALALAKKNGCLACHDLNKKLVGPAWKEVGKKYAGVAGAEEKLLLSVKKGSKDVWGPIPMPPNATVKDADMKTLVQFVLTLK
ncbi:MAG: c-type cytochrome [Gammaproteobacteria bacterium]|nr:c-type cytochrome [Rhodocyclaceae bacterium]MBU3908999.1 c-type cytochrome [Gammaproteobacteria bacterium]MBU4003756.1 c-type cytochrome [Gammaproteobacteria bacterium]MBU4021634.1 c-type cytochrome [Gammaproteobacteria bacterium]MBU4094924.1 c-type cytochrome [Gammaproteobacteria bacterium]